MAPPLATCRPLRAVVTPWIVAFAVSGLCGSARGESLEEGAATLIDPRATTAARARACRVVGEASAGRPRHDRALAALVPALADPDREVRAAAVGALVQVGDARAVPAMLDRLAQESDEVVLSGVLLAIGRLGGPSEVPSVTALRGHRSPRVRAAVATTLGDLGGPEAREALLRVLAAPGADEAWAVRGSVLLALARAGRPEDAGTIWIAYRDGDGASQWFARVALASVVATLDPDPMTALGRLVDDPDPRVSTATAVAVVRSGREPVVGGWLDDPRPGVRAAAAVALAQMRRTAFVPRLLTMATQDPDRSVRWSVALALARLDEPAADALLIEGLASNDPEVWSTALGECRRKTGLSLSRDVAECRAALAARRARGSR